MIAIGPGWTDYDGIGSRTMSEIKKEDTLRSLLCLVSSSPLRAGAAQEPLFFPLRPDIRGVPCCMFTICSAVASSVISMLM